MEILIFARAVADRVQLIDSANPEFFSDTWDHASWPRIVLCARFLLLPAQAALKLRLNATGGGRVFRSLWTGPGKTRLLPRNAHVHTPQPTRIGDSFLVTLLTCLLYTEATSFSVRPKLLF